MMSFFIKRFCHLLWRALCAFWPFRKEGKFDKKSLNEDGRDPNNDVGSKGAELSKLICAMIETKCKLRVMLRSEYLTLFEATTKLRVADKSKMVTYDGLREAVSDALTFCDTKARVSHMQTKITEIERAYMCYLFHRGMYVRKARMVLGEVKQVYAAINVSPSTMSAEELKEFTKTMETNEIVTKWRTKVRNIMAESEDVNDLTEKLEECVDRMEKLLEMSIRLSHKKKRGHFDGGTTLEMIIEDVTIMTDD
ncbi:unnamed protein product [Orchesella dallaii]|uniref:Uncharacterized protein n=1 Tax=Orchesella dallaii TaxID=48710 RepID=A0ABP1Q832_9HEXA